MTIKQMKGNLLFCLNYKQFSTPRVKGNDNDQFLTIMFSISMYVYSVLKTCKSSTMIIISCNSKGCT